MRFLDSTDLLRIEDILPFFPDFVVIDEFKEEICLALEACGAQIRTLKLEMDDATASAESIKRDIAGLKDRFVTLEPEERCQSCHGLLMTRGFHVFPCLHTLHTDCLVEEVSSLEARHELLSDLMFHALQLKRQASTVTLRRILALQTALVQPGELSPPEVASATRQLLSSNSLRLTAAPDRLRDLIDPAALAPILAGIQGAKTSETRGSVAGKGTRSSAMRVELEDLLAGTCVLCDGAVVGLDRPFVLDGEEL